MVFNFRQFFQKVRLYSLLLRLFQKGNFRQVSFRMYGYGICFLIGFKEITSKQLSLKRYGYTYRFVVNFRKVNFK